MFMTGVFRERVERVASTGFYITQGKRAYRFVSEHARARAASGTPPYRRLAEHFERYVGALDYTRRVHFPQGPGHPCSGSRLNDAGRRRPRPARGGAHRAGPHAG